MKLCITGINGFIGSHLLEHILANTDWEVSGFDLHESSLLEHKDNPRFTFVRGDIFADDGAVRRLVRAADVVLTLVGVARPTFYIRHPLRTFELDFEMNLKVVRMCLKHGKRVIFPSTSEVYGLCGDTELLEDESQLVTGPVCKSRWIYSISKQMMDRVLFAMGQEEGLHFSIFRPFNWTGPRLDTFDDARRHQARVITQMIYDVIHRGSITLVGGGAQRRSFTWVGDGIDCLMRIITNENGCADSEIFNIGNPAGNISIRELADLTLAAMGKHAVFAEAVEHTRILNTAPDKYYGPAYDDTPNRVPSVAKAARVLGWQPTTNVAEIVERTVAYYAARA